MSRTAPHNHRLAIRKISRNRGTTLIELLLYLGIVSILLVGVGAVSMSALDARSKSRAVSSVYAGATTALSGIHRSLDENSVIRTPLFGTASSTLALAEVPSSTTSTQIFEANQQLFLTDTTGTTFPLTPSDVRVDAVTFTALGALGTSTSVAVTLAVSASSTSMWNSYRFSETFTSTYVLGNYR